MYIYICLPRTGRGALVWQSKGHASEKVYKMMTFKRGSDGIKHPTKVVSADKAIKAIEDLYAAAKKLPAGAIQHRTRWVGALYCGDKGPQVC